MDKGYTGSGLRTRILHSFIKSLMLSRRAGKSISSKSIVSFTVEARICEVCRDVKLRFNNEDEWILSSEIMEVKGNFDREHTGWSALFHIKAEAMPMKELRRYEIQHQG